LQLRKAHPLMEVCPMWGEGGYVDAIAAAQREATGSADTNETRLGERNDHAKQKAETDTVFRGGGKGRGKGMLVRRLVGL